MNYTFVAEEIKCNGIGGGGYQAALKSKSQIRSIVDRVQSEIGIDELKRLVIELNDNQKYPDDLYWGTRFNSPEDITSRLISGLGSWSHSKLKNEHLVEMNVRFITETISLEDSITIVTEAARDCASADHWYTFEKEWD